MHVLLLTQQRPRTVTCDLSVCEWGAAVKIPVLLASSCLLLIGCSYANVQQKSRIASGERVTCRQVTPTGSHLPRTICVSDAQREQAEQDGREILAEQQRRAALEQSMRESLRREPVRP